MLSVQQITCGYGAKLVLFDISFRVQAGDMLGVIGPNGCGKSTLLRVLSRAIKPVQGEIRFKDRDLSTIPLPELARDMAVVSQHQPSTDMTVEEFVMLGRIPYAGRWQLFETHKDHDAVERALVLTGLAGFRNRFLGQMSGGERQLVFIARALAQGPKLLLLDEPTTHLDITHQVMVLDLVRRLNRDIGVTVVMILHDLNLAGEYCQRLLLLDGGGISQAGTPEQVLTGPTIERVYKTEVVVEKNPLSSRPCVFLVPEGKRKKE